MIVGVGRAKKTKAPRPTRSTSIESSLSTGLSPRKRPRRNSGFTKASGRGMSKNTNNETLKSEMYDVKRL